MCEKERQTGRERARERERETDRLKGEVKKRWEGKFQLHKHKTVLFMVHRLLQNLWFQTKHDLFEIRRSLQNGTASLSNDIPFKFVAFVDIHTIRWDQLYKPILIIAPLLKL